MMDGFERLPWQSLQGCGDETLSWWFKLNSSGTSGAVLLVDGQFKYSLELSLLSMDDTEDPLRFFTRVYEGWVDKVQKVWFAGSSLHTVFGAGGFERFRVFVGGNEQSLLRFSLTLMNTCAEYGAARSEEPFEDRFEGLFGMVGVDGFERLFGRVLNTVLEECGVFAAEDPKAAIRDIVESLSIPVEIMVTTLTDTGLIRVGVGVRFHSGAVALLDSGYLGFGTVDFYDKNLPVESFAEKITEKMIEGAAADGSGEVFSEFLAMSAKERYGDVWDTAFAAAKFSKRMTR